MKNGGIAAIFCCAPSAKPIEPHAPRRTVLSLSHHTGCRKPDLQRSVSSAVAPAALVMGERGKRVCGEEDLCEFLPAEAGARSERCGFHIDDITACLAAGFYFSFVSRKKPSLVHVTAGVKGMPFSFIHASMRRRGASSKKIQSLIS